MVRFISCRLVALVAVGFWVALCCTVLKSGHYRSLSHEALLAELAPRDLGVFRFVAPLYAMILVVVPVYPVTRLFETLWVRLSRSEARVDRSKCVGNSAVLAIAVVSVCVGFWLPGLERESFEEYQTLTHEALLAVLYPPFEVRSPIVGVVVTLLFFLPVACLSCLFDFVWRPRAMLANLSTSSLETASEPSLT
jgi:hypothetical protein